MTSSDVAARFGTVFSQDFLPWVCDQIGRERDPSLRAGGSVAQKTKKPKKVVTHLKLDLLANGIDFIQSGIGQFFLKGAPNPRTHKYAILHIFSGVLLLLKERLRRAHPAFVRSNIQDAAADARTVDFIEAVSRLKTVADCPLSGSDEALLRRAQKVRNQLEHYQVEMNLDQARTLVGELAEFVFLFMRDQLQENLEEHVSPRVWERLQDLRAIAKALAEAKRKAWLVRISKYAKMTDAELVARREGIEPYHPKHNPEPEGIFWCEECGQEAVVIVESDVAICTNPLCRESFEVAACMRCYAPVIGGGDFCESCQGYIDSQ
ncbi:MAG: hypothetical protein JST92_14425 [Deltaproteobacteria bacterium]|nr:hypothetical protein [Deltaproteobacteria bacterium]